MVSVSASVNLPLHHKVQKFSSGTGSPVWSRKRGRKTVVVVVAAVSLAFHSWDPKNCIVYWLPAPLQEPPRLLSAHFGPRTLWPSATRFTPQAEILNSEYARPLALSYQIFSSLYAIARPSVVYRLSVVCNARAPNSVSWNFQECFFAIWYPGHPLTFTENFTKIVPGESLRREG